MKSVVAGGFFLLSGSITIAALHITNRGNNFMGWLGSIMSIIGIVLIAIGLFVEED